LAKQLIGRLVLRH